jgi:hypothetical protein
MGICLHLSLGRSAVLLVGMYSYTNMGMRVSFILNEPFDMDTRTNQIFMLQLKRDV